MLKKLFAKNKGQTLVIFALAIAGLIAVAALIIDGGGMYVNRRQAQTAADSAAMAGVYELCYNKGTLNSVTNVVNNYAVDQNQATSVDSVNVDFNGRTVSVGTTVSSPSFFAVILGQENNIASAQATAGCFTPNVFQGVMPVTWTCRLVEDEENKTETKCDGLHTVPLSVFEDLYNEKGFQGKNGTLLYSGTGENPQINAAKIGEGVGGPMFYIILDDVKFDVNETCYDIPKGAEPPVGYIKCDFDGDGVSDVYSNSNRGWLALDGKSGAASLKNIVDYGFNQSVKTPQWFEGGEGVITSVYYSVEDRIGDIVLIPIYNAACGPISASDIPDTTKCLGWQSGDLISPATSGNSKNYYRVVTFAPFVVTCVSAGSAGPCPGNEYLALSASTKKDADAIRKMNTIEGYFISVSTTNMGFGPGGGVDLGVYIISLTP